MDGGKAFIYYGSATGLETAASWTESLGQANARFGGSVATAGDINGDGYADVIVGASEFDNGEPNEGRAYVYFGSASGLSAAAVWTEESDQAGAYYGASVGTAGDVNGDGYSDVIVGARGYDNGETNEGRVYVYHGSPSGVSPTHGWVTGGNGGLPYSGLTVATAGDINGDGYADVIVGSRYSDNGEADEGRAFLFHGSATGLEANFSWSAERTWRTRGSDTRWERPEMLTVTVMMTL